MGSSVGSNCCTCDEEASGLNNLLFSSTKPDDPVEPTDWSVGNETARSNGKDSARDQMKAFVVSLVRGRSLPVLSLNGGQVDCLVSFNKSLSKLSLKRETSKRDVPLDQICRVCIGKSLDEEVDLPVHDLCVTLLTEEQAVSLCFQNEADRDEFGECMAMLLAGREKSLKKAKSPRKNGGKRNRASPVKSSEKSTRVKPVP